MNYEQHFEASARVRSEFWNGIGEVHQDVLSHLINPAFMGGPAWPSLRQAFIKIDTPQGTIIASDGLSDPYSDFDTNTKNQEYNGVGCEFYIECDEQLGDVTQLQDSWQFSVLYQAAQLAAGNPNIAGMLAQYGYVSTELYNCTVPDEFINEEERTGVLFGLPSALVPAALSLSLETISLVNVKLLTLKELNYINELGAEGRTNIALMILNQPKPSKSYLNRESVV